MINENVIKVHDKTNEKVNDMLNEFPEFALRCKLGDIMKERGFKLQELSDLTGIRVATLSELANMKRTTINVPQLLVIAQVLRITDISKMFEFIMPEETREVFEEDQEVIEKEGLLPQQANELEWFRYERNLLKQFYKITGWKPKKKKPTS